MKVQYIDIILLNIAVLNSRQSAARWNDQPCAGLPLQCRGRARHLRKESAREPPKLAGREIPRKDLGQGEKLRHRSGSLLGASLHVAVSAANPLLE